MKMVLFFLIFCLSWELSTAAEKGDDGASPGIKTRPKEHIVVMGGGLGGITTALAISALKDGKESPIYEVTLVEKSLHLLDGTSKAIGRLHLGGEYPQDEITAFQCLEGAILFRQMFPPEVFTEIQHTAFIVSEGSTGTLSVEHLRDHYEKLQNRYKRYYPELRGFVREGIFCPNVGTTILF